MVNQEINKTTWVEWMTMTQATTLVLVKILVQAQLQGHKVIVEQLWTNPTKKLLMLLLELLLVLFVQILMYQHITMETVTLKVPSVLLPMY